jgi:alkyl sulfatase BDS1-like metallo-beta-lactamase superfamily hydrolase
LNHPKAVDADIALNFVMPDVDEKFSMTVSNGVMNYLIDDQDDNAQATITIDRATLDNINLGQLALADAVTNGSVTVDGDPAQLKEFVSLLDTFEFWFNIVTP